MYFHVVDGMLPDIMHDILVGTLQLHIWWLLVHFISVEKLFSLTTFKERLHSFEYGCDSTNKPSLISTEALAGSTVKQSCKLPQYRYGTLVHYTPQLLVYETTNPMIHLKTCSFTSMVLAVDTSFC